ncbi:AraC family transcriptional regulator [Photobacterium sp. J15]|uniref:AraC family transcriptional regulator n=1 Tax=Photobacterium sp. J15 TaxID=265901 RepID=UPI0007E4593D|nr:AraC family transcriptional regulator [Photobacterium sp. J15]
MKYKLEKVPQRPGMSWRHQIQTALTTNSETHYHHEFELNLQVASKGQIRLGQFQGELNEYHLVLIPPHMPHAIELNTKNREEKAESHSVWFKKEWIANMIFSCLELRKMETLLKRSDKGILFSEQTARLVHSLLKRIDYSSTTIHQLAILIEIIAILCQDKDAVTLVPISTQTEESKEDENKDKIEKLSAYINQNYAENITLSQLAKHLYMSESSIHRLFQRHFGESFSQHLKKIRLSHAARLLETTTLSVGYIADAVGYRNQANFNRKFKSYKNLTPREYRNKYRQ